MEEPERSEEGEESGLVRVLKELGEKAEGVILLEQMSEYFNGPGEGKRKGEEESKEVEKREKKKRRKEDIVQFGDLEMHELVGSDEDGGR